MRAKHEKMVQQITRTTEPALATMVHDLMHEGTAKPPAWRPVRSGAGRGYAQRHRRGEYVWMTTAEFVAWADSHRYERHSFGNSKKGAHLLGMGESRMVSLREGAEVTQAEAMAIAHLQAGLPLPCELTPESFSAWFMPRFVAANQLAPAIGMNADRIMNACRGYAVTPEGRRVRKPSAIMVRALDWAFRVGPFSPYGSRPEGIDFEGQPGR